MIIDEAFEKGSDESTKYALNLFQKLGLQLLIAAPLPKVGVLEDYVNNIELIVKDDKDNPNIRNITIEEYRKYFNEYQENNLC